LADNVKITAGVVMESVLDFSRLENDAAMRANWVGDTGHRDNVRQNIQVATANWIEKMKTWTDFTVSLANTAKTVVSGGDANSWKKLVVSVDTKVLRHDAAEAFPKLNEIWTDDEDRKRGENNRNWAMGDTGNVNESKKALDKLNVANQKLWNDDIDKLGKVMNELVRTRGL
jgi:hypothetical protein